MYKTVKIPKKYLTAPVDLGAVISMRNACGVPLTYAEFDFIRLDGGKVVMFDAYSAARRYLPLEGNFGAIAFPFCLSCMTDEGERVAYAGLRFSENKPVKWDVVCSASELLRLATASDAGAVPIVSGVCAFSDEKGYDVFRSHINDELSPLSGLIVLDGQTHTVVRLYDNQYAVFSSGWGDGAYRIYAGRAENGKVAILIADFGMISYPDTDDGEYTEISVECDTDTFVYDPSKTDAENRIAKFTAAISASRTAAERMRAYSRRGYAYHSMNDVDRALSDYLSAIDESKNVADKNERMNVWSVFDNAAEILCQKSDHGSAIELMNDALSMGDDLHAGVYVRLIDLYLLTKRVELAVSTAERMRAARPDDPVAYIKSAEAYVSAMDYGKAAEMYSLLASEFQLFENLFDEASCLIETENFEGALAALERHPAKEYYEQYWYYKAYIDYKKRDYAAALENARRSYDIDKGYMPVLYLLIDIQSVLQEYHAVARYAEEYKKIRPDAEYGYSVCAEAHLILGNFSECARNYKMLFDTIRNDDKTAAMSAVLAAKTGDEKRKSMMLKRLRHKKSAYYYGASYAVYITKYRARDTALSNVVYKLDGDDDFLLQLSTYLTATGNMLPAIHILEMLCKRGVPTYDIVAQQIRSAEKLGDKKLFDSFMHYYIVNFLGKSVSYSDVRSLYEKFTERAGWIPDVSTYVKKYKTEAQP